MIQVAHGSRKVYHREMDMDMCIIEIQFIQVSSRKVVPLWDQMPEVRFIHQLLPILSSWWKKHHKCSLPGQKSLKRLPGKRSLPRIWVGRIYIMPKVAMPT